jgi:two-component system sensor histidine kinase KdpD
VVLLFDELAHSNTPRCRHSKRRQDMEELLDAGIDVLTTANVQHLVSINDIVGGITGIRVLETVPDRVFAEANEVVPAELPPDDFLVRLREGKVYLSHYLSHIHRQPCHTRRPGYHQANASRSAN